MNIAGLTANAYGYRSRTQQDEKYSAGPLAEIFYTLKEAQVLIEEWRLEYNTFRPHSSLKYRPPAPEALKDIKMAEL
jgi:transposase InsO family protein